MTPAQDLKGISGPHARRHDRRIRVLLVAPSMDIVGGQAVQATRLMRCLQEVPWLDMRFQPINPRLPGPLRLLQSVKFVRTAATAAAYNLMVMAKALRCDILHVFSASYYSYTLWTLPALFFAKLYRKKMILNYRDGQAEDHLQNWRSALPTIRLMDAIVTPSGFLVDVFARFRLEALPISNIIDASRFHFRRRCPLRPVFLHNRILEPLYNVECSLRAFQLVQQRYPEASLTIAHDGPSRPRLERFARDLGLRNTRFIGRVPHSGIAELYDAADIYLTSPEFDCMPGSLLECYASGLPIIATATGGIPYIARDQQTALLVRRNDHEAMAGAAFRLLDDEELVERLTTNGYEECKKYAAGPVRDQWAELYERLMFCTGAP